MIDFDVVVNAGPLLTYKFVLSINHGNETLISDERNNNHFIEIGLAKPSDWDDEEWLSNPIDEGDESDGDNEEDKGEVEGNEEE